MIRFVTMSRISKEKGFERMIHLESKLKASGVPFVWDCYGDTSTNYAKRILPRFRHVKFKGVTDKPLEVMKQYDYLVQLSDTEGFPYSIYEAMQQMVPVIATDFPSIHEMIVDGENGYILKMDLSNFDINKLQSIPVINSFMEKSTEQDWLKLINMAKPTTKRAPRKAAGKTAAKPAASTGTQPQPGTDSAPKASAALQAVKVTRRYHDTELDKKLEPGHEMEVTAARAKVLVKEKVATKI